MNTLTNILEDDFIAILDADCPSEWAVDTDEIGNPVYSETDIIEQLQLDAA